LTVQLRTDGSVYEKICAGLPTEMEILTGHGMRWVTEADGSQTIYEPGSPEGDVRRLEVDVAVAGHQGEHEAQEKKMVNTLRHVLMEIRQSEKGFSENVRALLAACLEPLRALGDDVAAEAGCTAIESEKLFGWVEALLPPHEDMCVRVASPPRRREGRLHDGTLGSALRAQRSAARRARDSPSLSLTRSHASNGAPHPLDDLLFFFFFLSGRASFSISFSAPAGTTRWTIFSRRTTIRATRSSRWRARSSDSRPSSALCTRRTRRSTKTFASCSMGCWRGARALWRSASAPRGAWRWRAVRKRIRST
jgi:hypothetical protein